MLRHAERWVLRALEFSLVALLAGMVVMVFGNVVLRYLFNSGIDVSEELSRYFFVWLTFIGAVVVMRENGHLGVDSLVGALGDKGRRLCMVASDAIVFICCLILLEGTWKQQAINASAVAPVTGISMAYVYGVLYFAGAGIALGLLSGMFRWFESLTAWVVRLLRPIPGLAWVPFAIIWFGVQPSAAVFIIAIGVFWIVFFATQGAVRGVDRDLIEVAQAFGFRGPFARLTKILLPAATPGILVGLRTALGQAWMAVVAAEIFGVPGIGARMMQASSLLSTDIVVVYMLTMAGLYGLFDTGFVALQGWLLRWRA